MIYKYDVPVQDALTIEMPQRAEVLCVQMQHGSPRIWVRVDLSIAPFTLTARNFAWRGTGHSADGLGRYIGTVQMQEGRLVFHLFESP